MNLSKRLRELRAAHELTQKQIAAVLNIDRSAYSYYETGKSTPPIPALIAIAKIYNISLDELLLHKPMPQKQNGEHAEMFGLLSKQEQDLILRHRCFPNDT